MPLRSYSMQLDVPTFLGINDVQALVCGKGQKPTAQYLAGRERILSEAIARASSVMRSDLQIVRANFQRCVRASAKSFARTTLPSGVTSVNSNRPIGLCSNDGMKLTLFAKSLKERKLDNPQFHITDLPGVLGLYQVDICTLSIGSCVAPARSQPYRYQTSPNRRAQ